MISVYAPCGLDDSQKNYLRDSLINIVRNLGEKEIVVITGDFNGQVGSNPENYEGQHGGYGFKFCVAMSMTVGNKLFKKRASHLATHESGPSKTQVKYCLVRRNQKQFLKDTKVLHCEECITQHKPLVCDFKIRKVKDTRRKSVLTRKTWKLHEDNVKSDFRLCIINFR